MRAAPVDDGRPARPALHGPQGRRWVLVAIANHPRAGAIRNVAQALVQWAARQP